MTTTRMFTSTKQAMNHFQHNIKKIRDAYLEKLILAESHFSTDERGLALTINVKETTHSTLNQIIDAKPTADVLESLNIPDIECHKAVVAFYQANLDLFSASIDAYCFNDKEKLNQIEELTFELLTKTNELHEASKKSQASHTTPQPEVKLSEMKSNGLWKKEPEPDLEEEPINTWQCKIL